MIQPRRSDLRSLDFPFLAPLDLAEKAGRGHRVHVHREIGACDLRFQYLSQAIAPQVLRLKAIKVKAIVRFEEWMEKWNALKVVPVIVRYQNVSFHSAVAPPSRPAVMPGL